jgi:hypothetical protein
MKVKRILTSIAMPVVALEKRFDEKVMGSVWKHMENFLMGLKAPDFEA